MQGELDRCRSLPNGVPGEAQRKRVRWGKEEKGSERSFSPKGGNGVHGLCDDAGGVSFADGGVLAPQFLSSTAHAEFHRTKGPFV